MNYVDRIPFFCTDILFVIVSVLQIILEFPKNIIKPLLTWSVHLTSNLQITLGLVKLNLLNHLYANPTKWPNTHKQFVGKLPTNCLSVFDHFVKLALKGLIYCTKIYNKATIYVNVLKLTPFSPSDLKCKKT